MAEVVKKPARIPIATPNIASPNASSANSSQVSIPLETALRDAVGGRIRITNSLNAVVDGILFTADPITNLIVIASPSSSSTTSSSTPETPNGAQDFHVMPIARIQKMELLSLSLTSGPTGFSHVEPKLRPIPPDTLQERVRKAVEARKRAAERVGKGVGREAQDLFDGISRTLPTRWHGQSIIVLDAVMIEPPYTSESCRAPEKHAKELARVRKVVDFERKKIADRKGGAQVEGGDMRKGG